MVVTFTHCSKRMRTDWRWPRGVQGLLLIADTDLDTSRIIIQEEFILDSFPAIPKRETPPATCSLATEMNSGKLRTAPGRLAARKESKDLKGANGLDQLTRYHLHTTTGRTRRMIAKPRLR